MREERARKGSSETTEGLPLAGERPCAKSKNQERVKGCGVDEGSWSGDSTLRKKRPRTGSDRRLGEQRYSAAIAGGSFSVAAVRSTSGNHALPLKMRFARATTSFLDAFSSFALTAVGLNSRIAAKTTSRRT